MLPSAQFFLYGDTPVISQPTSSGGQRVPDLNSLEFFADSTDLSRVLQGRDNLTRERPETESRQLLRRLGTMLPEEPRRA